MAHQMADNQLISNSYLSNNPDIRPRAIEKTTAPAIVATLTQVIGIDIGGTGAESLVTSLNPLPVSGSLSLSGFTTLTEGEKNISAAATPEAIGSGAIKKIIITAKETNTGTIWVKSTVTNNSLGRPLLPLQAETLEISNLNLIFLKATVNADGVTFLAFS